MPQALSQNVRRGGFGNQSLGGQIVDPSSSNLFERAEVMKINLDSKNKSNIGAIRFRFIHESGRPENNLPIAYPMFGSIKAYPVLHEVVLIYNFDNKYYYSFPLNFANNINENSMKGASYENERHENRGSEYQSSQEVGIPDKKSKEDEFKLGEYFESKEKVVSNLIPDEGDVIIQGRFGNNIRLGSNSADKSNLPQIKISLMDDEKVDVRKESLDKDNSLWLSNDGKIPFEIKSIPIHKDNNPPVDYDGKQVLIFSDRLVFQSKANEIIFYSKKGIHFASNLNWSADTDKKILTHSKDNTEINTENKLQTYSKDSTEILSLKTYIGKIDNENLVLGQEWKKMMEKLLDILINHTHPTGTGPSGPPIQAPDLKQVKSTISDGKQLSEDNFTTKKNR
jgi:hypothetical protein